VTAEGLAPQSQQRTVSVVTEFEHPDETIAQARKNASGHLTEEQVAKIIDLKLRRFTEAKIATQVGCSRKAIRANWRKYLDEASKHRVANVEANREEIIQRYDRIATDAHLTGDKCRDDGDHTAAVRYMEVEKGALREIAKLQGLENTKVEVRSVTVDAIDAEIAKLEAEIAAQKALSDKS